MTFKAEEPVNGRDRYSPESECGSRGCIETGRRSVAGQSRCLGHGARVAGASRRGRPSVACGGQRAGGLGCAGVTDVRSCGTPAEAG